ncbi:MAG: DNA topoisomerase (ATP-hydrolyzing) subunit B [Spirochaetia bacterium]|nr:DNA topoisomerase (ATP-hydrolyzing) subunit B [Spirochaetia bacterium]
MQQSYSAQSIQVLKGLEAVRKRPGMYIGTTGPDGLHHLVYEVVDNSIDEALAGYCTQIDVRIEKGNIIAVSDNGRGIPVDIHPEENLSALEVVMTKLHAGGKFDKDSYKVSGGLHGVGVSVVNALSSWLEVNVHLNGRLFFQRYRRGIPEKPVAETGATERRGTVVRFEADSEVFETTTFSFDVLSTRLRELAFLNKGILITICDERIPNPKIHEFRFDGGVKEFVTDLNSKRTVIQPEPVYFDLKKDDLALEYALQYNDAYNENMFSFVNNINTREGGTHLIGFKSALTRTLNEFLKKSKLAKKLEDTLTGDDVREGLTAVVSVKIPDPQFEGQTKAKLGNSEVKWVVESLVNDSLSSYFEENPDVVAKILEKTVVAAQARNAARKAREKVRKNPLGGLGLPDKLADCREKDPTKCEIYIVEGDSAGGSAKQGRDSKFQAILSLWGKMLNVEKTRLDKVMSNDKLQPIIAALGAGAGDRFAVDKLRYHKVIIMADADVDGSHIRTLLLTFFFRYMREMLERGYVYIAMPPLYKVSLGKKVEYAYDDAERDRILQNLNGGADKAHIQRYKGLGEMNPDQLWETTMNPETRNIIRVQLEDMVEAEGIFVTLMGDQVGPRREFIEENALFVSNLDV